MFTGGNRDLFFIINVHFSPTANSMSAPGSLLTLNINDGFIEALLRGLRLGLLSSTDYTNLTQCDQLDGKRIY